MSAKNSKPTTFWTGLVTFIVGAIAEGVIQILIGDLINATQDMFSTFPISFPLFLQIIFLLLIIIGIILIAISYRQQTSPQRSEYSFDHVEAWFFYPKKYSLERNERDPKKIVPKQKLALVEDLKKAYYIGEYALNLVKTGKIKNCFTDDKKDNLDEWCTKKGYIPTHEEATEDKLLEPYFEAEIKNKKQEYHRGDIILFRTHFRGKLTSGFFDNRIIHSQNKKFHRGRILHWKKNRAFSWASDTLSENSWWIPYKSLKGMLNGYVNHTSEWCWAIPLDAPLGEYRISMSVFNRIRPPPTVIRQKEDTITIVV